MKKWLLVSLLLAILIPSVNARGVGIIGFLFPQTFAFTGVPSLLSNNTQIPTIYSGNLNIYLNPSGYYEYVITPLGSKLPVVMYADMMPGTSAAPTLNVSQLISSNSLSNSSIQYSSAIFYSGLIDITPLENQLQSGGIYPYNLTYFIQSNKQSFTNATLIFQNKQISVNSTILFGGGLGGLEAFAVGGFYGVYLYAQKVASQIVYSAAFTTPEQAIPIALQGITNKNLPLNVSFTYPGTFGLVKRAGTPGMYDFNNYIDNTYAPEIETSIFLNQDVMSIFVLTLIIFIVKKMAGSEA